MRRTRIVVLATALAVLPWASGWAQVSAAVGKAATAAPATAVDTTGADAKGAAVKRTAKASFPVSAVKQATFRRAADAITAAQLKDYLTFIASDEMEGRTTPSRGLDTTARFIATELSRWGAKPRNWKGTGAMPLAESATAPANGPGIGSTS